MAAAINVINAPSLSILVEGHASKIHVELIRSIGNVFHIIGQVEIGKRVIINFGKHNAVTTIGKIRYPPRNCDI